MARITRKSFRRKKVVLGLCMFASVALISTGFAAWILSADATKDNGGQLGVGVVNDRSVKLNVEWPTETFRFDSKDNDTEGRLKYDTNHPNEKEMLAITIKGYVSNAEYLDHITAELTVSNEVKAAAETDKYIELPECDSTPITITNNDLGTIDTDLYTLTEEDLASSEYQESGLQAGAKICRFSYKVEFKWGEKFGNKNPGEYYDDPATGGKKDAEGNYEISNEEVSRVMADLKSKLETNAEYTLTLTAVAKS